MEKGAERGQAKRAPDRGRHATNAEVWFRRRRWKLDTVSIPTSGYLDPEELPVAAKSVVELHRQAMLHSQPHQPAYHCHRVARGDLERHAARRPPWASAAISSSSIFQVAALSSPSWRRRGRRRADDDASVRRRLSPSKVKSRRGRKPELDVAHEIGSSASGSRRRCCAPARRHRPTPSAGRRAGGTSAARRRPPTAPASRSRPSSARSVNQGASDVSFHDNGSTRWGASARRASGATPARKPGCAHGPSSARRPRGRPASAFPPRSRAVLSATLSQSPA